MSMNKRTSTKQKLLNILKKDHKLTMKEIMAYFTISEIAVRRHIHELIQQGFLKKQSMKQEIGRPYYIYELTEKGHATFPNENDTLPLEILQDLEAVEGPQVVKKVLAKRMERDKAAFQQTIESDCLLKTLQRSSKYKKIRSEEHTSELQSRGQLVCRLLLENKKSKNDHED